MEKFLKNKDITNFEFRKELKMGWLSKSTRSVFGISVYDNLLGVYKLSIKGVKNQIDVTSLMMNLTYNIYET